MVVSICRKCVGLSAQKINFIPLFYLEILQDFVNVLFWVLWASLNMPNKIDGQLVEKINVYLHVKNKFLTPFYLEMLPRYCKLILGTLGMSGYSQEKWQYQLAENFGVCLYAKKSNLLLTSFLKYHYDIETFTTPTKNNKINLFIYMPKINLIPNFFLEILQKPAIKETCNTICREHFSP